MRATIIFFSPSGHTAAAARFFREELEASGVTVQSLDITKDEVLLDKRRRKKALADLVEPHDVLFVGGPIYAGHVEKHVLDLIRDFPRPRDGWATAVVPFITYGGLHSSVALEEMGRALFRTGRKNILGIKIVAFHTLTRNSPVKLNPTRPGPEERRIVALAVARVIDVVKRGPITDQRRSFAYSPLKERLVFTLLSQDHFHKKYRLPSIDKGTCVNCGICIMKCPMNMFKKGSSGVVVGKPQGECILCAECFHGCSQGAISYPYWEIVLARMSRGTPHLEPVQSAVYPPGLN